MRVNMRDCAKFHVHRSNFCWERPTASFRFFFQNGGLPPSSISYVHVWTTHDEYLVVFITVQNLAGIDAVISTICKCWMISQVWLESAYSRRISEDENASLASSTDITVGVYHACAWLGYAASLHMPTHCTQCIIKYSWSHPLVAEAHHIVRTCGGDIADYGRPMA